MFRNWNSFNILLFVSASQNGYFDHKGPKYPQLVLHTRRKMGLTCEPAIQICGVQKQCIVIRLLYMYACCNLWGALNFFFCFGRCVPCRFQNLGSREQIFLEKWGSWEQKKNGSRVLEFGQNMAENPKIFLKLGNGGHKSGALTLNW